jgi:hypothetical protein
MIGGRKIEHLKQNIQALEISLSREQIQRIDNANPIDIGFPYTVIVRIGIQLPSMSPTELMNRGIVQTRRPLEHS